jgi:hypothetical protein
MTHEEQREFLVLSDAEAFPKLRRFYSFKDDPELAATARRLGRKPRASHSIACGRLLTFRRVRGVSPVPANKKRKARAFDIQILFAAHLLANTQAQSWAAKCIALRRAGKTAQADAAESRARHWLKTAMELGGQSGHEQRS